MINLKDLEVWFVTGSQHLYGEGTLKQVAQHSSEMAQQLTHSGKLPARVIFKPVVTTPEAITALCQEANNSQDCIGLITWMHTFSPAKMWIAGLSALHKPFVHLHTQYNREIPWGEIDMDFMNLNQSAHGDREYGFIGTRLRLDRKVVVKALKRPSSRNARSPASMRAASRSAWRLSPPGRSASATSYRSSYSATSRSISASLTAPTR